MQLQRTIGNRAVGRWMATATRPDARVQRLPISPAPGNIIQRKGAGAHATHALAMLTAADMALESGEALDQTLLAAIPVARLTAMPSGIDRQKFYLQEVARHALLLVKGVQADSAGGNVTTRQGSWTQPLRALQSLFGQANDLEIRTETERKIFAKTQDLYLRASQLARSAERTRQQRLEHITGQPKDFAPDTAAALGNVGGLDQYFGGPSSIGDFTSKLATTEPEVVGTVASTGHENPQNTSGQTKVKVKEKLTDKGQDAASAAGALSAFGNVLGIGGNVAGVLGLVGNVRQLKAEWHEKSKTQRLVAIGAIGVKGAEQGILGASNVAGVAGNVGSAIAAQGSNESALEATASLGVASDLVNDFMAGLRSVIEPFMNVYRLFKDLAHQDWMSAAAELGHIARRIIDMARFGVKVVKSLTHFVDALGPATVALPFLSSGIAMIAQAWDFFESMIKWGISLRRKSKLKKLSGDKAKAKLGVSGIDEDSTAYLRTMLDKRMHRNYLTASVTAGKFLGEMQVMVGHGLNAGGYTAPAGVTLNVTGAVTKLGSSAAGLGVKGRWKAKQLTHNYQGRREDAGKGKNLPVKMVEHALFFTATGEKSKRAKAEARLEQVMKLMDAIDRLSAGWSDDASVLKQRMKMDKGVKARYQHIRFIVRVTGVDFHKLLVQKDKYKQAGMLFKALAKR